MQLSEQIPVQASLRFHTENKVSSIYITTHSALRVLQSKEPIFSAHSLPATSSMGGFLTTDGYGVIDR